jgi:DNA polymerase-3 subunit beta
LLEAKNSLLKLTATDLEVGITSHSPVEVREEGSIILPGKILHNLVKNLSDQEIEIISFPDYTAEVRGKNSYYKLSGFPPEDFPIFPPPSTPKHFSITEGKLKEGLSKVYFTTSKDESNPPLTGVLLHWEGEKLNLVASDDHLLGICTIEVEGKGEARYILPLRAVVEIIRLAEERLDVFPGKGEIIFQGESIALFSRLIEGEYPHYQRVIPQNFIAQVSPPRSELREALERVSTVSSPDSPIIEFLIGGGKIEISSSGEMGMAKEKLEVETQGEELKILFNARYLLEALRSFSEEKIIWEMSGESSASRLRGEKGELQYILMPIEIKE